MRSLKELESKVGKVTPELKKRVMTRVSNKLDGIEDGTLDEPLEEIVINEQTAINLEKETTLNK